MTIWILFNLELGYGFPNSLKIELIACAQIVPGVSTAMPVMFEAKFFTVIDFGQNIKHFSGGGEN